MMKMDGVKQDEQVQGHLGAWGVISIFNMMEVKARLRKTHVFA
jgi:hypothetical protein